MKIKYILAIIQIMFCLLLTGCISTLGALPYGVWKSEAPYILLDITYEDEIYHGEYEKDGEIIDITFQFMVSHKAFDIFDSNTKIDNPYFAGSYTYTKDKLVYKLYPRWAEEHGIKEITFTKIQDYEPEPGE